MVFLIEIVVHAQEEVERRRIAGQLAEQGMYLPAMVCLVVKILRQAAIERRCLGRALHRCPAEHAGDAILAEAADDIDDVIVKCVAGRP